MQLPAWSFALSVQSLASLPRGHPQVGDPLITGRVSQALSDTLLQLLPDADAARPRGTSASSATAHGPCMPTVRMRVAGVS